MLPLPPASPRHRPYLATAVTVCNQRPACSFQFLYFRELHLSCAYRDADHITLETINKTGTVHLTSSNFLFQKYPVIISPVCNQAQPVAYLSFIAVGHHRLYPVHISAETPQLHLLALARLNR